ncbi:ATP phosphoribosyltransferase regulatory subunit [Thiomicrospira microaerophila]|uniref:ATP phosphoribosyltransferase regulatory subunit n=1 Tax=Thiomicrospira microaerophila TaxID=406020 RepID=UPI00200E0025|nr:ATP phosphoribosyltransferase regulatory subunit [Thiomicrospira microaerophila]UQB41658.1 ATP phosphoribosyltransferase regulatory subunit [Thiomicrospira microaerophila]
MQQDIWFTPEGIEDLLPQQAEKLEYYRQGLLNELKLSGYLQVLPPIAEFTDSLLTGTGRKLALDTCRFTDYETGRMMGVRADMTPQVARIVSNRIKPAGLLRLCYVGEVLKSRNNKAKGSRSPIQLGAELFGHKGVESDIEIIDLMLGCARYLALPNLKISLGHVGIVQELMAQAAFDQAQQDDLVDILKRKAMPEYQAWLSRQVGLSEKLYTAFSILPELCGDAEKVIDLAKQALSGVTAEIDSALADVETLVQYLIHTQQLASHLDLSDLRGFQYHTGVIFACYSVGETPVLLAKGGRYDEVCAAFGEAHPATGFSLDLRNLLDHLPERASTLTCVYAPISQNPALYAKITSLRTDGIQVVRCYGSEDIPPGSAKLVEQNGDWIIQTN